jgi:signal transduction histidine kinase
MKSMLDIPRNKQAATIFLVALLALLLMAWNEFSYQQSNASLNQLLHRVHAIDQTQSLLRRMTDAETGQRGFLLTGQENYLEPYQQAARDVRVIAQSMQTQYQHDPAAKQLAATLLSYSEAKLSELEASLEMHRMGRHEAWKSLLSTEIGREKMNELRRVGDALLAREAALSSAARQEVFSTLWINRMGIAALATLGILGAVVFWRQSRVMNDMRLHHESAIKAERDALQVQVAQRTADLTELAKHLQVSEETDKADLARKLHDELGALLTTAKLDLARLKRSLGESSVEVGQRLEHLSSTINAGIHLKRRIIENLRPSSLGNLGLLAALQIQLREFSERSELTVESDLQDIRLSAEQEIVVYRFVQEALANIARHARASAVQVTFKQHGQEVYVGVGDNGVGLVSNPTSPGAHGLLGMRYRLEAVNGRMNVRSEPGSGTTLEAWLPL